MAGMTTEGMGKTLQARAPARDVTMACMTSSFCRGSGFGPMIGGAGAMGKPDGRVASGGVLG